MVHSRNPKNTEVDAYSFIKEELEKLDWIVKNPARFADGEVYKQNEVLANIELKKCLVRDMPEAVVKLTDNYFWVIESKRDTHELNKALEDCINQYAEKINRSNSVKCLIISGVAGNDSDGYVISNMYLKNGLWEKILINGEEKTSLLSKDQAKFVIENDNPNFNDFPEFSEKKYLSTAERINEILHLAAINKSKRARFIAGIILSYVARTKPNLDKDTTQLVKEINDNIEFVLEEKGKKDFIDFISLQLPPNTDNHIKYKHAIIQTYRELNGLDIKSAMNSGNDVLGKFYEVFLKYGNGAKEIGIVLTPRHISKFAVEVLDIKHNDFVLDPTCGTGGFLVSAFDYVKQSSTIEQINKFKEYNIFGTDGDDDVVALALVNMIFRGDGRNNIREGDCFQKNITKSVNGDIITGKYTKKIKKQNFEPIITKVLMNPPFALKKSDEKEFHFINHALTQTEAGAILFSVFPYSGMVKTGAYLKWRKELLKKNTLLSVVTFPEDLFYPVGVHTVGFFIKMGTPHPPDQNVFWIRALNDGYLKKKGKRLENSRAINDFPQIKPILQAFLNNQQMPIENIPEFQIAKPIDFEDSGLELVPEAYLDQKILSQEQIEIQIEQMMRETAAFIITSNNEACFFEDN